MPDYIGDTNHPYYPGATHNPTAMSVFLSGNNPTPTPAPGTTIPTSTTNLPTNPSNLAAGLATDVASSNLAASPYMKQLSDLINQTNQAAQQSINANRFGPGGAGIQDQFLSNIKSGAAGQLPQDVINQTLLGGAERGGDFGVDSPNTNAAVRRALGLNSLQLQNNALKQYGDLASLNPLAPLYSMQDQLVSPGTYSSTQQGQRSLEQQQQQFADELKFKYYAAQLAAQNRGGGGYGYPSGRGGGGSGLVTPTPTTGGTPFQPPPNSTGGAYSPAPTYNPYDPTGGFGGIPSFSSTDPWFGAGPPNYFDQPPNNQVPGAPTIQNANDLGGDWLSGYGYDPGFGAA